MIPSPSATPLVMMLRIEANDNVLQLCHIYVHVPENLMSNIVCSCYPIVCLLAFSCLI